ncbi:unnamed protein product [Schistosoma margrebowiei]|uniref:Uncharacterized protein n=1 Tax=Schistosoma margrebowiei TaxID=48269 RepID=A0A3P7XJB4_9TREM|nr:unnamed protein product [Schistosoma margrebowiei]
MNLGQSKDTRKYQSSSDYGCQVEIPTSNLSILNCHQYPHNLVNSMNENNIKDSVTVKDSIPHSTSLTLITSQLDEIKQETNSLRSIIRNLSFQLSDHLARDCCDQCVKNVESLPKSDVVNISTSNSEILLDQGNTPIDKNLSNNNDNIDNNNMPNGCNRKVVRIEDEETTANFYARLTAVEMLLRNAESTEARLEKEFSHLIINDEKSSLPPPPPPSSLSTAIFMEDLKPEQEQRILDEKSLMNKCIQDNEYACSRCKNNNAINNISRNKHGKLEHQCCILNSSFQKKITNTIPLSSYHDRSHSGFTRRRQRQRQQHHHHHHCVAVDSSNYSKPSNCNIIETQTIECCSQVTVSSSLSS